jgi:biotin carboxyl carrier protein
MKLDLLIDGAADCIQILTPAPACRFQLGDGPAAEAHVEIAEPGVYSVLMNGRSYDARVEERADGLIVVIDGYRFEIEVRDPRRWSRQAAGRGADGVQTITAPMPGKVVRILVAAGDSVEAGQGLMVVEAMKMQNEMKAPRAGKVRALAAQEGVTVSAGDVLITIE